MGAAEFYTAGMARVMAASFTEHGRLHFLDPGDDAVRVGEAVLVPTDHGPEVARCAWLADTDWPTATLPPCAGRPTASDLSRDETNRTRRAEIRRLAEVHIARLELPMTVVAVDHVDRNIDSDRLAVIYFRAPHRVDFRVLLGDLARALRSRIDLRQVGPRDTAALVGDLGPCGRELCCVSMCPAAAPGSRPRSHDATPGGACGRSQCCLSSEPDGAV